MVFFIFVKHGRGFGHKILSKTGTLDLKLCRASSDNFVRNKISL